MKFIVIESYNAAWNLATNQGYVILHLPEGQKRSLLIDTAEEYASLLATLAGGKVHGSRTYLGVKEQESGEPPIEYLAFWSDPKYVPKEE